MSIGVKGYEVYICTLDKDVLYIGSGRINRHKHCNSGTSHVYGLNKLHFEGNIFDVNLKFFLTKEESLEEEKRLINQHLPRFNIVHTSKNTSKVDWLHNGDKLRKAFIYFNRFPEKSSMFRKMNNLLDLFLDAHKLPMIESEGVLLRTRSYYKSRGYHKIYNLIKNHKCTNSPSARTFLTFFSLLKLALEKSYEKEFNFTWFREGNSFAEDLLSFEDIFGHNEI